MATTVCSPCMLGATGFLREFCKAPYKLSELIERNEAALEVCFGQPLKVMVPPEVLCDRGFLDELRLKNAFPFFLPPFVIGPASRYARGLWKKPTQDFYFAVQQGYVPERVMNVPGGWYVVDCTPAKFFGTPLDPLFPVIGSLEYERLIVREVESTMFGSRFGLRRAQWGVVIPTWRECLGVYGHREERLELMGEFNTFANTIDMERKRSSHFEVYDDLFALGGQRYHLVGGWPFGKEGYLAVRKAVEGWSDPRAAARPVFRFQAD